MAIKIYSDVTKNFYDSKEAAEQAEKELEVKKAEAAETRKKMAKEVEEKQKALRKTRAEYYSALKKAREEYYDALNKFCEKYGTYHVSVGKEDWNDLLETIFNW